MQMQVVIKELSLMLKFRANPDTSQNLWSIVFLICRREIVLGSPDRTTMRMSLILSVTASTVNAFALMAG